MCEKKWRSYLVPALCVLAGILAGILIRGLFTPREDILCRSLNLSYRIDDREVALKDGKCLIPVIPGEDEMMLACVNCLPARGDLNGDGRDDSAVVLMLKTEDGYLCQYVAAAMDTPRGAKSTNAVFLGEGCSVLNLAVEDGIIWTAVDSGSGGAETDRQFVCRNGELMEIG